MIMGIKKSFISITLTSGIGVASYTEHIVNFINIQNSHVIPMKNATVYPVRTGYDSVLAYRLPKKFIGFAIDDGIVETASKNKIIVNYKNKGKKTYIFKDWNSKEESNSSFIHRMKSNVVKGQTVKHGDVLYYDSSFFEPDFFDKTKVTYKPYLTVTTALMEINETFEDSSAISKKIADLAEIEQVKSKSVILDCTDEISNVLKIGDKVNPNTALMTIGTSILDETGKLSEEALDILQGFIKTTPKAKVKGEIIDVKVFYHCEKENMSESIREIVEYAEKFLVDKNTGKKYTGKVDSSYSIKGKPLDPGKIEIKYYFRLGSKMVTGDKAIFGNQLKTTVGEIFNYPIVSDSGKEIDALFSARAIYARIVNSPSLMGTTARLLREISKKAADMYLG